MATRTIFLPVLGCVLASAFWLFGTGQAPTNFDAQNILLHGLELTSHSWEYGALVQAMLELENASIAVFGTDPFPSGRLPVHDVFSDVPSLQYARTVIWTNDSDLLTGGDGKWIYSCFNR
jgi:hypothetical protein